MAEPIRRSPLHGFGARFATMPASVRVAEEPFVAMVDLWVDPADAGTAADALGVSALPGPSQLCTGHATVIWLGPQEWLVTSTSVSGGELEARLRAVVVERGGGAVDVSAQRTTLRLSGTRAREVLAKGCSLDLHPSAFGPGAAAQTMLAQAAVVLIPLSGDGTDYRILVRASFARHLAEWLLDATIEYR